MISSVQDNRPPYITSPNSFQPICVSDYAVAQVVSIGQMDEQISPWFAVAFLEHKVSKEMLQE